MKTCVNCGVQLDDNAAFCNICGTNQSATSQSSGKEPISIGGWIGRSLIPCIPFVGGIVYLIMLFVWSGDTNKEDSFRNWAKAQLIVMAIFIALIVVFAVSFGSTIAALAQAYAM